MLYPKPASGLRPVRVGILLGSFHAPEWVQQLVRDIHECDFATLAVVLIGEERRCVRRPDADAPSNGQNLSAGSALYWLYTALDKRFHPDAVRRRPLDLGDADLVPVERNSDGSELSRKFRNDIESRELDVLLDLGFHENVSEFVKLASKGVLFSSFGEADEVRRGPALLWRIYDRPAKAGTYVRVVHEIPDGKSTALESYSSTSDSVWLSRHSQAASWRASTLFFRFLRAMAAGEKLGRVQRKRETKPAGRAPSNRQMRSFFLRCGARLIRKKMMMLSRKVQWLVAYRTDSSKFVASSERIDLSGFVPIVPERDHVYADPCVVTHLGVDYIFIEDLLKGTARGTIAVIPIQADGTNGPVQQVLARDHHLSYPFVFEWEGNMYMLPETSQANSVQLYRATNFPLEWRMDRELLKGRPMVDSTLQLHQGTWFLFLNAIETRRRGSLNDELFLFVAETPLGPWKPHPKNPICSDVRRSRPAGRLFARNGRLIRPSQDCSERYGSRINLCEVKALSESHYEEEVIGHIDPRSGLPGFDGCHTISFTERVETIDLRRTILRFGDSALEIDGGAGIDASPHGPRDL